MNALKIEVATATNKIASVELFAESSNQSLFAIDKAEAEENGEAPYQILEGYSYEYRLTERYSLEEVNGIVYQSKLKSNQGRITPNIYVGTLTINILDASLKEKVGELIIEVRSVKATYRQDYRLMLEEITEKCTDLLLQANSPVSQYFTIDFDTDSKTLYQRFAFIKAMLLSDEFTESVHKFLIAPITRWTETEVEKDIRNVKRINNRELRQVAVSTNRINLPDSHSLKHRF